MITVDQITQMAPDNSSATSGKKLSSPNHWQNLGKTETVIWGECKGSALYKIRVELTGYTYKCSCPSRKIPCKHILGLLFLSAEKPNSLSQSEPPEWVTDWMKKKEAATSKKKSDKTPVKDSAAQQKRIEKREQLIVEGLNQFELWLCDIIRNGLGNSQIQSPKLWEEQASRLVDFQIPGLASRLKKVGSIPGSSNDWTEKLLYKLGYMYLVVHAYRNINNLSPLLQADLKQIIGWTYSQNEVESSGEKISDLWVVVGQTIDDSDKIRMQKTWILGQKTGKSALILQFSMYNQPFQEVFLIGTLEDSEIVYWPSAYPMRAKFLNRKNQGSFFEGQLLSNETIVSFLNQISDALSVCPFIEQFLCVLKEVKPFIKDNYWYIQDKNGDILPLKKGEHFKLLAVSGGHPVDIAGEWDGLSLIPMSVWIDKDFVIL
ncbi:MAG: SWIM zinc finger family protein [Desulfamplus sp.]|nr:SWIM zinc finger family protein [Desulfamplus sp.]